MDNVQKFKALADDTRLEIINMLSTCNLCACQLLEHFHISQATLSYHMKILQESNLVTGYKDGYWTRYYLNVEEFSSILTWLNAVSVIKERKSPMIQCQKD